jgi:hypothetical protein
MAPQSVLTLTLLTLPPEIRLMIYEHLIGSHTLNPLIKSIKTPPRAPTHPMLLVNSLIHCELQPLIFRRDILKIPVFSSPSPPLERGEFEVLLSAAPRQLVLGVRNITLALCTNRDPALRNRPEHETNPAPAPDSTSLAIRVMLVARCLRPSLPSFRRLVLIMGPVFDDYTFYSWVWGLEGTVMSLPELETCGLVAKLTWTAVVSGIFRGPRVSVVGITILKWWIERWSAARANSGYPATRLIVREHVVHIPQGGPLSLISSKPYTV